MVKNKIAIEGDHNTINVSNETNLSDQPLVIPQRKYLNHVINELAITYNEYLNLEEIKTLIDFSEQDDKLTVAKKYAWHLLHRHLGVESISQIQVKQFQEAKNYLEHLNTLASHKYIKCKKLVHNILKESDRYNLRKSVTNWTLSQFGEKMLNNLSYEQLLETMNFVNNKITELQKPRGLLGMIKLFFK